MKDCRWLFVALSCVATAAASDRPATLPGAPQKLRVARPFADNAILQRGVPCPVFGIDAPGRKVTVSFAGQNVSTTVDRAGQWRVNLAELHASSEPRSMTIAGSERLTLTNLLVGDVWLISGQSNADFPLRSAAGAKAAISSATNALLRYFVLAETVRTDARAWTATEVDQLNPERFFAGTWQVSSPSTAGEVSAVGYFFATELQTNLSTPLGLIDCSVGGTPADSWIPNWAITANADLRARAASFPNGPDTPEFVRNRLLQNLNVWNAGGRKSPMPEHPYKPGACWHMGLAAIAPSAIRGVIWYQGETDADFSQPADYPRMSRMYVEAFKTLVGAWRTAWESPGLAFYFVQLPQMNRPSWPWFRESQWNCAQSVSNTAMAVAFEQGDPGNVHPANKAPVAHRLALIARALTHGQPIEWSGPVLRECRITGSEIILSFDHASGGLCSSDSQPLRLFEIAGEDRRFHPAHARISGSTLVVTSDQVPAPAAVRYAWIPAGKINFYNGAGLPASPFRTDNWPPNQPRP